MYLNSVSACPPRTGGGACLWGRAVLLTGTSLLGTGLVTLATWLTHRAFDGRSGVGWTILGTFTASLVGAAAGVLVGVAATGHIEAVPMIIGAGVFSATAGGLMTEVGHMRAD